MRVHTHTHTGKQSTHMRAHTHIHTGICTHVKARRHYTLINCSDCTSIAFSLPFRFLCLLLLSSPFYFCTSPVCRANKTFKIFLSACVLLFAHACVRLYIYVCVCVPEHACLHTHTHRHMHLVRVCNLAHFI